MKVLQFMFIILLLASSCKKTIVGPQGPSGINGKDGVANLKVYLLSIKPEDWKYDDLYKQWYYQYKIGPKFSDSTMVSSSILTNNGYQAIPFYDKTFKKSYNFSENLSIENSYVEFQYYSDDNPELRPLDLVTFKLSILPK
jgi:hypothetical protein